MTKNGELMVAACLTDSGVPDLDIPSILAERSLSEARARTIVNWVEAGITRKLKRVEESAGRHPLIELDGSPPCAQQGNESLRPALS